MMEKEKDLVDVVTVQNPDQPCDSSMYLALQHRRSTVLGNFVDLAATDPDPKTALEENLTILLGSAPLAQALE